MLNAMHLAFRCGAACPGGATIQRVAATGDGPTAMPQGMRPAFLALIGLLAAVVVLVVILSLTGSLTGFGS